MDTLLHRRLHFRSVAAWTPASPTTEGSASPAIWWDVSALTGFSNNDSIGGTGKTLTDLVGTRHGEQTTSSAQPTYLTNKINGLPVAYFDGGDLLTFTTLTYSNTMTFFMVIDDSLASHTMISMTNGSYTRSITSQVSTTVYARLVSGTNKTASWPLGTGQIRIITVRWNSDVPTVRMDGAAQSITPGDYSVTGDFTTFGCNSSAHAKMYLGEMMLYTSALSANDITQVETYLNNKWAAF